MCDLIKPIKSSATAYLGMKLLHKHRGAIADDADLTKVHQDTELSACNTVN